MYKKIILPVVFSVYSMYYAITPLEWHFIDAVNLLIHEAGHVVGMFFGTFFQILGGSLLQVLFPALFVGYFFRQREYYSASLTLFWVGQNIINVSVYAKDAAVMQLPLLGGDNAGHDWNNLLSMTGLLRHTNEIGTGIYILGIFIIVFAAYFSFATLQEKSSPKID